MKKLIVAMVAMIAVGVFAATDVSTTADKLDTVVRRAGTGTSIAITNDRLQEVWIPISIIQDAGGSADSRTVLTNAITYTSAKNTAVTFRAGQLTDTVGSEVTTALTSYPSLGANDVLTMTFTSTNANVAVVFSKNVIPR